MKRFPLMIIGVICIVIAAILVYMGLRQGGVALYMMPDQIMSGDVNPHQRIKAGGIVVPGSVKVDPDTALMHFEIEHQGMKMPAEFNGLAPALFQEGSETILEGWYRDGVFKAERILAKHDEDYTLPERHKQ
ncbi:MAG: cytochrome c maturation protein CcmE [Alphaproteobacteria bacterium]